MKQQFLKYVLQNVAGMIGVSVCILADTFFISVNSGADGITVLNFVLLVYGLIFAIGSMIGVGSATRYAMRKVQEGKGYLFLFCHAILWEGVLSIPFLLFGLEFYPGTSDSSYGSRFCYYEFRKKYIRVILIAAPFFMMNYVFTAFARNDNASMIAMLGSILGSVFNIVCDYIFMFPMG